MDLNPTQKEVDLEALIDVDQLAAKAPRAPAHTSSIAGVSMVVSRTQPEQRRPLVLDLDTTEEAVAGKADGNGQERDLWRDQATNWAAGPRSRSPPLTPVLTPQRHKRPLTALESDELADMAATKMEDLVEHNYSFATNLTRGAQHTEAWTGVPEQDNLEQDMAESRSAAMELTPQDSSDIPAWVLAESEEMSRDVTPPT